MPGPGKWNGLTDVEGVLVGSFTDAAAMSGVTVILCPEGTVAAVDVRGAAPGTRETDLLEPVNLVQTVQAVVLAGGTPLLNDMTEALVLDALSRGAVPSEAARAAGVDPRTLRRWCQRGREAAQRAADGIALTEVEERMRTFDERVEQARMAARLRAVDRIQTALTHEEVCLSPWAVLPNGHHPILDDVGTTVDGHEVRA